MRNCEPDAFPTARGAGNVNPMNRRRLMSRLETLKIADLRSDNANRPDFYRVLEHELKLLYLLAFLLTANRKTAEQCFDATVEQALNGHKIAHQVKATILKEMPQILEVLVHIEPEEELLNQTDASIVEKNPQ
jgi:hypothetical protein